MTARIDKLFLSIQISSQMAYGNISRCLFRAMAMLNSRFSINKGLLLRAMLQTFILYRLNLLTGESALAIALKQLSLKTDLKVDSEKSSG